jgi:RNA polymerase sigma-70 factor (ECF subfamily)
MLPVRGARGFSSQVLLPYGSGVTARGESGTSLNDEFIRIRATLARYLRARGAGDQAEDLVQELWLKIASLPATTDVAEPSFYLFRMAHNLMLDRRRTEVRRAFRERAYVELGDGHLVDPTPTPDRALEAARSLEAIQHVLRGLGERTDYIFRRHRIDGVGQRDIAAEVGITLSAVEKHLQKAYKAVHAAYLRGGEHDPD